MKIQEVRESGSRIAARVETGDLETAYALLAPVLAQRTPFVQTECIGEIIGAGALETVNQFLDRVAVERTEGGWVVISGALRAQLDRDRAGAFARAHKYIIAADVWYAPDILGERVPGPALVQDFAPALELLAPWRADANRWVRRAVGVVEHFWAKRSRGAAEFTPQAQALLNFVAPMFEEWDMDAVKGVGWGLKTLGKHYPDVVTDWLIQQKQRPHRALMLRKATTYLSDEQRARVYVNEWGNE